MPSKGFSAFGLIAGIVVVALIVVAAYSVFSHKKTPVQNVSSSATKSSTPSAYATLTPATVPSKAAECIQAVAYASNGVPGPTTCPNGDLNAADWNALAALEPKVLSLGYNATASQVQSALCSDVETNISNPIEETVYQIASLYYGWNFTTNPSLVISNNTCVNVDD